MPGSRPSESAPGVENATGLVKRYNITRIDDAVGEPLYSYGACSNLFAEAPKRQPSA